MPRAPCASDLPALCSGSFSPHAKLSSAPFLTGPYYNPIPKECPFSLHLLAEPAAGHKVFSTVFLCVVPLSGVIGPIASLPPSHFQLLPGLVCGDRRCWDLGLQCGWSRWGRTCGIGTHLHPYPVVTLHTSKTGRVRKVHSLVVILPKHAVGPFKYMELLLTGRYSISAQSNMPLKYMVSLVLTFIFPIKLFVFASFSFFCISWCVTSPAGDLGDPHQHTLWDSFFHYSPILQAYLYIL